MTPSVIVVGSLAAILLGASKTGIPTIGAFGIAVLALVMPPVESSGVVLPALLVGDLIALHLYGRSADRGVLRRVVPSVVIGVLLGYLTLRVLDAAAGGRVIGALLMACGLGELIRRGAARRQSTRVVARASGGGNSNGPNITLTRAAIEPAPNRLHRQVQHLLGAAAGLSTMVANAGGPMMTVHLLRAHLSTVALLGTSAWFFFAVNLVKVPFSVRLGLITWSSLPLSAMLVPGLLVGATLGRLFAIRAPRALFDRVALLGTAMAGLWLLVR